MAYCRRKHLFEKENNHLKDRIAILECVLDQILRDQELKRKEDESGKWRQSNIPARRGKIGNSDTHSETVQYFTAQNRYQIISDKSEESYLVMKILK